MSGLVHWEEGLFLQPHHLQMMQRQSILQAAAERSFFQPFPYGVIEARLSSDELADKQVRFERLRVVTRGGLYVSAPEFADLPALDITKAFAASRGPLTIFLGVPKWSHERGNTVQSGSNGEIAGKRLFRIDEVACPDENSGVNPQQVRVRRVNARLLLDGDDHSDLEVLPLLRVAREAGEQVGLPRQDDLFAPPCLVLHASPVLTRIARDLAHAVESSRQGLALQLSRGGFSIETIRGMQFEQVLRLQALSRAAPRLLQLAELGGVTPFTIYLELRTLLADLAAMHPERTGLAVSEYDHDNPAVAFSELDIKLRSLLKGAVAPSYMKVDFVKSGRLYAATLADEHFARTKDFYLGIRCREDRAALVRLIENGDEFKLMPQSKSGSAVRGVKLTEERIPPLQLPAEPDLQYFRLVRGESGRVWELVQREKSLTAQWPGAEAADWKLTLFMPSTGEEGGEKP